jgi:hypothetical protein
LALNVALLFTFTFTFYVLAAGDISVVELPERFYPVGFYRDFSADKREGAYNFASPSTMKPTQARVAHGLSDGHPDLAL